MLPFGSVGAPQVGITNTISDIPTESMLRVFLDMADLARLRLSMNLTPDLARARFLNSTSGQMPWSEVDQGQTRRYRKPKSNEEAEQYGCRQRVEWHLSCHRRFPLATA